MNWPDTYLYFYYILCNFSWLKQISREEKENMQCQMGNEIKLAVGKVTSLYEDKLSSMKAEHAEALEKGKYKNLMLLPTLPLLFMTLYGLMSVKLEYKVFCWKVSSLPNVTYFPLFNMKLFQSRHREKKRYPKWMETEWALYFKMIRSFWCTLLKRLQNFLYAYFARCHIFI